jgi:hypothetical protein
MKKENTWQFSKKTEDTNFLTSCRSLQLHPDVRGRYRSIWGHRPSFIPCVLKCDVLAIESYGIFRDVSVPKWGYDPANGANVVVMGIIKGPPRGDDPPISKIDGWTDLD